MSFLRKLLLSFIFFTFAGSSTVQAQVDPTSQLLLRPAPVSPPRDTGLQSGRYKVKANKKSEKKPEIKTVQLPTKKVQILDFTGGEVSQATTVVLPQTTTTTGKPIPKTQPTNTALNQMLFVNPAPKLESTTITVMPETTSNPAVEPPKPIEQPPVAEQVKNLVLGNELPAVEAYKEQIHPDDVRMNRLEINVLPGVVADSSKSSYSYRSYSTFSPKILLGAEFWMTPFLGIYGSYTASLGADAAGDPSLNSRVPVQHEWFEVGIDLRRFFGMSRRSTSLQYGIHISEYKFVAPGDDMYRVNLKSTGIGLHLSTRVPVAPSYAWVFGGKIIPRVQHNESATGVTVSSGSLGESSRVDLSLGGEMKLQRQNQIIWDLTVSFEKNHFGGEASLPDSLTGVKPKGVSVENTFTIFSLGYRWGQ